MASSTFRHLTTISIAAGALSGCVGQGFLYSHTRQPLMTDFEATPVVGIGGSGDVNTLAVYVNIEWGSGGIGAIAREQGIGEIYYADVETISIFRYWKQDVVHIYGRPAVPATPVPPLAPASR